MARLQHTGWVEREGKKRRRWLGERRKEGRVRLVGWKKEGKKEEVRGVKRRGR